MSSAHKYFILIVSVLILSASGVIEGQIAVIASKNLSAKSININTLINLYTMRSNEIGGEKVRLFFNNSESEISLKFISVIQKTPAELKKIWLRARLTNSGLPPQTVSSDAEMLSKIIDSPNSVGFIDLKTVPRDVKILLRIE